jgi:hypothetical protein
LLFEKIEIKKNGDDINHHPLINSNLEKSHKLTTVEQTATYQELLHTQQRFDATPHHR